MNLSLPFFGVQKTSEIKTAQTFSTPGGKYQNFENFDYRYSDEYDGITLRIHLPKGTKGAAVTEDEFLLGRNSQLKITDYDENTHVAECEYILPE